MERRRFGAIQHFELVSQHLDVTGGHVRVDRALGTLADPALDGQHELAAYALCLGEDLGPVGIENDLQEPFAIAQIDEDHAAVVTAAMYPAADRHFLSDQRLLNLSAIMAAHGDGGARKRGGMVRPEGRVRKAEKGVRAIF